MVTGDLLVTGEVLVIGGVTSDVLQMARPELPAPYYICMYRLLPTTLPSPSRNYYPRLIAGTNLPTPKGWIAWLVKADCTHTTFSQGYYIIESKGTRRK